MSVFAILAVGVSALVAPIGALAVTLAVREWLESVR